LASFFFLFQQKSLNSFRHHAGGQGQAEGRATSFRKKLCYFNVLPCYSTVRKGDGQQIFGACLFACLRVSLLMAPAGLPHRAKLLQRAFS
jgi:hypothetical protein